MASDKIGIENFRVFKEYTEFEIRPITLLTGPNNSGKSSFTKLLLLLKNRFNPLNFEEGLHNLESFEKVLNWIQKKKSIKIALNTGIFLGPDSMIKLDYRNSIIKNIDINYDSEPFISFKWKPYQKEISEGFFFSDEEHFLNFNIEKFIDLIYSKEFYVDQYSPGIDNNGEVKRDWGTERLKNIDLSANKTKTLNLQNLKQKYTEVKPGGNTKASFLLSNIALFNEIDALEKDYLIFDCKVNGENLSKINSDEILQLQKEIFNEFSTNQLDRCDGASLEDILETLKFCILNSKDRLKEKIEDFFIDEFNLKDVEVKLSRLGKLIFEEPIFNQGFEKDWYYESTILDQLLDITKLKKQFFNNIDFISSNRANQKRVLQNKSDSEIDELILEFSKLDHVDLTFLNKGLNILGIEGKLVIERFQNFISVVHLEHNDSKIPLSDLGFGFSQVIPILLKISIMMHHPILPQLNNGCLIIEEPEANLHPNLQSKLADLFVYAKKKFPGLTLIIETHSEYLIRKLQFLTANREITPDLSIIYYFNSDKYVSSEEPKVKRIEINQNGNLSDNFGPGFYDEATRLQFDLLKLNKAQIN